MNDDVKQLAEALFLKSYNGSTFLHVGSMKHTVSVIKNSIEVAELFYQILEEKINETK